MKKFAILVFIIFIIANYAYGDLNSGLKAYYPFNNDVLDGSMYQNHGTLYGDPKYINGIKGQAISLDGIDDYANLGLHNFSRQLSISLWVKLTGPLDSVQAIISKYDEEWFSGHVILKRSFVLSCHDASNDNQFYFNISPDGNTCIGLFSKTSAEINTWYHIVAIFDEGKLSIYVNGIKENAVSSWAQSIYYSDVESLIGTINDKTPRQYSKIIIDDLRLYDYPLSESDILLLSNDFSGPNIIDYKPTGLIKTPLNYIDIFFNKPINSNYFNEENILLLDPFERPLSIDSPIYQGQNIWRINFSDQSTTGAYTFRLNPGIMDDLGNQLDQDQDGDCGENEDFFEAVIKVSVIPHTIMLVYFSGSESDNEGLHLSMALQDDIGARVQPVLLSKGTVDDVLILFKESSFDQVWVYDMSAQSYENYSQVTSAISEWFLTKPDRAIICDSRMRESFREEIWKEHGVKVAGNYYENLKLNGGGLLLATGNESYHNDINDINKQIGISPFMPNHTYPLETPVIVDTTNELITQPNPLASYYGYVYDYGNVPWGAQGNSRILYPVAWYLEDKQYAVSTTIETLIPNPSNCSIEIYPGHAILSWKPKRDYHLLKHYSVYVKENDFSRVNGMKPSISPIYTNNIRIDGLRNGLTYFFAVTAVNMNGSEIKKVNTISGKIVSVVGGEGGGCFINTIFKSSF